MTGPHRRSNSLRGQFDRLDHAIELVVGRASHPEAHSRFERYLELLSAWNRSQRLTGVLSPERIVADLFVDSLLFLKVMRPGDLKVADIGAGAGIPGVPMAIARPEIAMTLIESKRKRVSFLLALQRELGLQNLTILEGRAEALVRPNPELRSSFDVVVTRAAGPVVAILPIAMSYLEVGGLFVAGGSSTSEVLEIPGLRRQIVELRQLEMRRTLLTVSKLA